MERHIAKVGDKREFAQALHSYAQDLSYAASSAIHDELFRESCEEIVYLIEEIPSRERTKSTRLYEIINQLLSTSKQSYEFSEDLEKNRPKLANDFIEILKKLYPVNIEFSRYPFVKHQSF